MKIRSFEELSLASESNESNLLRELVNHVNCHVNFMCLDEFVNHPLNQKKIQTSSKGHMATWIDSFLELATGMGYRRLCSIFYLIVLLSIETSKQGI